MDFALSARSAPAPILLGLLLALAASGPSAARTEGPFDGLSGAWSGEGSIGTSNGTTERLRCQSTYAVGGAGDTLNMDMRCRSDSSAFEVQVNATNDRGRIVGAWNEVTRGVQGGIEGRAANGKIQATVRSQAFTAAVALATRGSRQEVTIRAPGQEFQDVSVTLHRGR